MNVLYVHERFGSLAGAEANVLITARELQRRRHEIGILHGPGTGKDEDKWRQLFGRRFALEGKPADAINATVAQFRPDVIYVHKMADLEVIRALLDVKKPLVRMVHDHDIYCMRSYKYNYFTRAVCHRAAGLHCLFPCGAFVGRNRQGGFPLRWISYRAKKKEIALNQKFHRMVVVSHYMRDELLRNGFDARRIEIHPPVPPAGDPFLRSSFSARNLILYAGQIIRGKGVDLLLRALALLPTPFECVILGEGSHRPYCEALSKKLGLESRVSFKGFVPQEQLKHYYGECSVVAISSVWPEPFATIGMEVMRYGLPVVAFNVGGLSDWLINGLNGFLVPSGNCAAYASRIQELLENKDLAREMGQRALRRVDEQFSFSTYIDNLETMFAKVLTEA
jgi:glycosyltransferase involved in cell wall biosynthesis